MFAQNSNGGALHFVTLQPLFGGALPQNIDPSISPAPPAPAIEAPRPKEEEPVLERSQLQDESPTVILPDTLPIISDSLSPSDGDYEKAFISLLNVVRDQTGFQDAFREVVPLEVESSSGRRKVRCIVSVGRGQGAYFPWLGTNWQALHSGGESVISIHVVGLYQPGLQLLRFLDSISYEKIRDDHGLHVSAAEFPSYVAEILQSTSDDPVWYTACLKIKASSDVTLVIKEHSKHRSVSFLTIQMSSLEADKILPMAVADCHIRLACLKVYHTTLQSERAEKETTTQKLNDEIQRLTSLMTAKSERYLEDEKTLRETINELTLKLKGASEDIEQQERDIRGVSRRLEAASDSVLTLKEQLKDEISRREGETQRNAFMYQQLQSAQALANDLRFQNTELSAKLGRMEKLQADMDRSQMEEKERKAEIKQLEQENKNLKDELSLTDGRTIELERQVKNLRQTIAEFVKDRDAVLEEGSSDTLVDLFKKEQRKVGDALVEVETLRSEMSRKDELISELQNSVANERAELRRLNLHFAKKVLSTASAPNTVPLKREQENCQVLQPDKKAKAAEPPALEKPRNRVNAFNVRHPRNARASF